MENRAEKYGIQVFPPSFILIYKSENKYKKKVMPLRRFKSDSNVKFVSSNLMKRHDLLGLPQFKIEKMLRILQELMKGVDKEQALDSVDKEFTVKIDEDLNKLSTSEIETQKSIMDTIFKQNQVKPDDPEFVYDKQVEFSPPKESSGWDQENDDFWGD